MDFTTKSGPLSKSLKAFMISFAIVATTTLPAIAANEPPPDLKGQMKSVMQEHPELMQEIMANPHHVLAMAYRNNLLSFGQALKKTAGLCDIVPPELARTAVNEMKHSLDQLEKQHAAVLQALPADKKALLGDIPTLMQEHLAEMKMRVNHLDDLSKKDRIPSKDVLDDLQFCFTALSNGNERHARDWHAAGP